MNPIRSLCTDIRYDKFTDVRERMYIHYVITNLLMCICIHIDTIVYSSFELRERAMKK